MSIAAKDLPGSVGKEIVGLDLSAEIPAATARRLREAWLEAGILLFRGAASSDEALLRLSRCFGELEPHPIEALRMKDHPELICLSNEFGLKAPVYAYDGVPIYGSIPWHTDLAFMPMPNAGALLRMVRKATTGGQTAFLDTAAAYDAMSDSLKRRLAGREACFAFCADRSTMRFCNPGGVRIGDSKATFPDYDPIARPLVWQHPMTGRTILNICPLNIQYVVGMDAEEGDALIREVIDHAIDPRFVYEHDWAADDVMLWDNYRMMHRAAGHPVDVIRTVHRSTIRGVATVGRPLVETPAA